MKATDKVSKIRSRSLILFLILVAPLLILGPLILIVAAQDAFEEVIGHNLSRMADQSQMALSDYLQHLILQVASLTAVPDLHARAAAADQEAVTPETLRTMSASWENLNRENSQLLREILDNPASMFLRDYRETIPFFREILVTDVNGLLVAASNKTSDYYQADERWWHYAFREGVGGHFISDMQFDPSAGVYALEIAEPIIDKSTESVIGIVKVIVDSQQIFSLVNSIEVGSQGRAMLLGRNGTILVSPEATVEDQSQYQFFGEVRQGVAARRDFVMVGEDEERVFIGLPGSRLKDTFPDLDWYLVVVHPYEEASYPMSTLYRWFIYGVLISLGTAFVLAVVFTWLLSKPIIEADPHFDEL